jgi:hypothetical protein
MFPVSRPACSDTHLLAASADVSSTAYAIVVSPIAL